MATTLKGDAKGSKDGGPTSPEVQDDVPKDSDEEKDAMSTALTKTGTKKAPIRKFLQNDEVADAVFHRDVKESVRTRSDVRLTEMMEDDEQLGLYDDEWQQREYTEDSVDAAIAEHNAHEDGFSIDGGFDGNPIKSETGTTYFSVPVNFYTDDLGNKVYDYEGMADQFEEQLSELDESAVVMVSVEIQPINKELIEAAKKYKKKVKTQ